MGKTIIKFEVLHTTGCWIWLGAKNSKTGYGSLGHDQAHRRMYELIVGHIPKGKELDHVVCNRRDCVNPTHCKPKTHKQNVQRFRKGQKLTMRIANKLRREWVAAEPRPHGFRLAFVRKYGISDTHLDKILKGVNWT